MKVVILCGGTGSRIALETKKLPKPMIKIGKKPILIHIMEHYKKQGFNHFILACGYKHKIILMSKISYLNIKVASIVIFAGLIIATNNLIIPKNILFLFLKLVFFIPSVALVVNLINIILKNIFHARKYVP